MDRRKQKALVRVLYFFKYQRTRSERIVTEGEGMMTMIHSVAICFKGYLDAFLVLCFVSGCMRRGQQ